MSFQGKSINTLDKEHISNTIDRYDQGQIIINGEKADFSSKIRKKDKLSTVYTLISHSTGSPCQKMR